jgi:hypothetical protein
MNRHRGARQACFVVALVGVSWACDSTCFSTIDVLVTDDSAAPVTDASVALDRTRCESVFENGRTRENCVAHTTASGHASFRTDADYAPTCEVTVTAEGFQDAKQTVNIGAVPGCATVPSTVALQPR